MKVAILALALVAVPAQACDWQVTKQADPMTDTVTCRVYSSSARIAFYRYGTDRPNISVASAYSRPAIYLRVDDREAVRMGDNAHDRQRALDAILPQLREGQRLRVQYSDYPQTQHGDAEICDLPELLDRCTS